MQNANIKSYIFELDGTLCHTHKDDYVNSLPMLERIEEVNLLYSQGNKITIKASRNGSVEQDLVALTNQQLKDWELDFHELILDCSNPDSVLVSHKSINSEEFFEADHLSKESGGKTKVVLVNRVYKEATDERMDKLIDEITFIDSIPEPFNNNFPKVSYYKRDEKAQKVYYEMPHYELPSLRRMIFL